MKRLFVPVLVGVLFAALLVPAASAGPEPDAKLLSLYKQPPGLGLHQAIAKVSSSVLESGLTQKSGGGPDAGASSETPAGLNVRTTGVSDGTQAEISLAATGGGGQNIVAMFNGGPNGLGYVSSQNGGQTFQGMQSMPTPAGSNPCCDPSIVADNASSFFAIQLYRDDGANTPAAGNCTNSLQVSTDGGQTFSNIVGSPFSYAPGNDFPDQPHIGIDRANPQNLYVFTRHFTSGINCPQTGGSGNVQGEVVCSNDGGLTWSNPFVFPQFTDTAHLDVDPSGRAFVVGNGAGTNMNTTRVILWRASATGCPGAGNTLTYTGPTVVADNLTFGAVGIDREFPQPSVLADPTMNDRLYINYSADSSQGSGDREAFISRCDYVLAIGTCTAPLTVNDNPVDGTVQYFPMACIDPASNNIFVSWNDARSGQHQIRATTVTNNGTTTGTSTAVSLATWTPFNFGGAPDYGDYNENNGACRANHHYAAWTSHVSPAGVTPASNDPDVFFAVVNEPPVADADGPYATQEGVDVSLSGNATDAENDTPFTFEWDLDNDGQFDDATGQTPDFTAVGQDGVFDICLRVTDSIGDSGTDCTTVTVTNVAPTVGAISTDSPKDEATAVSISGTITDPGWLDPLTATIDFGDGLGPQPLSGVLENVRPDASLTYDIDHLYGDDGTFTIEICAADDDTSGNCNSTSVDIANLDPTATIDESGSTLINGVPTIFANAGENVDFSGNSTDPGSDDLLLTWDWGDGGMSPDEMTAYLVNPPFSDPDPSPDVNPRDVDDMKSNVFGDACFYTVVFEAMDDDSGFASDDIAVVITGNSDQRRGSGYWHTQYDKEKHFTTAELECFLLIVGFISNVFDETTDASTIEKAESLLQFDPASVMAEKLDRALLTAWLNLANGSIELETLIDTDGDGIGDTSFGDVMTTAETVRLDPTSTEAQLREQKDLIERINLNQA